MQQDLISVIVPCYNVEKFIGDCFKSLENQTYQNIEVIFVNDGSTDKTLDKIKAFCEGKKKFRYIDKPNGGLSSARNAGLSEAKGKFIYFLDSDDAIHPDTLKIACSALKSTKADFSIFKAKWVKDKFGYDYAKQKRMKNRKTKIFEGSDNIMSLYFARRIGFTVWSRLFRHDILKKMPEYPKLFNENTKYSEDLEFNTAYIENSKKAVFINKKLYYYRQRKGGLIHSKFNESKLSVFNAFDRAEKLDKRIYKQAQIYISSHKAVVCLEILFRIIKSDYDDKDKIKKVYSDFCENLKYVLKAKRNPFYIKLLPCAKPYIFLKLRKRLKK